MSSAIRGLEVLFRSSLTASLRSDVARESQEYPRGFADVISTSSRSGVRCLVGCVFRTDVPGARSLLRESGFGLKLQGRIRNAPDQRSPELRLRCLAARCSNKRAVSRQTARV